MRYLVLFITLLAASCRVAAQNNIEGIVADSVTQKPLAGANVTLVRQGKSIAFARTNANGLFAIKGKIAEDGDRLSVTMMGYEKRILPISSDKKPVKIWLSEKEFVLKEVEVKGGRIFGKQDTVTYDLTRFVGERDNSLKDVLKKLPGVNVAKNGQISYNGKELSRFTVEGLDLTGGRYNKLTESIKATDVEKAEVIEHDQPIKALRDKIYTDDVAMNIKLKDEARDKWMPTIKPMALASGMKGRDLRVFGDADVLQVGKSRQRMYNVEYDRSGRDLSMSDMQLTNNDIDDSQQLRGIPSWYNMPELSSPIDEERLRFNTSENFTFKQTAKTKKDNEYRITAGYSRSVVRQRKSNRSLYYIYDENPVLTDETAVFRKREENISGELYMFSNHEKYYGNNRFSVNGSFGEGVSHIEGTAHEPLMQRVKRPEVQLSNSFYRIYSHDKTSLSLRSVIDFRHSPQKLFVNDGESALHTSLFQTNNSLTWMRKHKFLTQSYNFGMKVDNLYVGKSNTLVAPSFNPYWQYRRNRMVWRLRLPMEWLIFVQRHQSYLRTEPHLSLSYEKSNRSEIFSYVGYSRRVGWLDGIALEDHWSDYRTHMVYSGVVPISQIAYAGSYYNYKRPIKEFFWRAGFNISRSWLDRLSDMVIEDGKYHWKEVLRRIHSDNINISGTVSKGFFDLHLKTRLDLSYRYAWGMQGASGRNLEYDSHEMRLSPEVIFSPSWGGLEYAGTFTFNKSKNSLASLPMLLNWRQSLSLTKTIGTVDLSFSMVHYRNELQESGVKNTLMGDANIVWRMKKCRLKAELRNVFNQKDYVIAWYGGISSYTNYYELRPRELMLTMQYTL